MKKRSLLMILALALSLTLAIGGTLAYLQDTDADVNVMTLGSVHIKQHEYERVTDENGDPVKGVEGEDFTADYGINESYKLQEFTSYKPAMPAVYQKGTMDWDDFQQLWNQVGAPGSNDLFDDSMKNVIDKFVFVENTGKSDAYYRTIIAIECPEGITDDLIHTSFNANSRFDYSAAEGVQNSSKADTFFVTLKGVRYLVYTATYQEILTPGEVSRPSLLQLYLDPAVNNEHVALFGENWEVLTLSQAIQAAGFTDAASALNTGFYDPATDEGKAKLTADLQKLLDNEYPQPAPENGDDPNKTYEVPAGAVKVASSAELTKAVADGATVLLLAPGEYDIDGCTEKKLTLVGEDDKNTVIVVKGTGEGEGNGQLDYGFDSSTVTFQNLTIKTNNQTYAGYARLVGTYKNVTFENCYCLNSDSQFENCTFNVAGNQYNLWTWGAPTATFTNCTFNSDGKAILLYGTANTKLTLTNCVFNDTGVLPDLKTAVEIGNDYNKSYELIVNNVDVNGYEENPNGIKTGSTLWSNKNSMSSDNLNVVIDGYDVY